MLKVLVLATLTSVVVASCWGPSSPPKAEVSTVNKRMVRPTATSTGRYYYASPSGSSKGNGSIQSPWDLQTALYHDPIQPGDTLWLRGGTYNGTYTGRLTGSSTRPVIVRQYPGERAIIDGGNSQGAPIFTAKGTYTWYWGFEIMSSDPTRYTTEEGSSPIAISRGEGILVDQSQPHPGLKFINMIIHDARQGISFWKEASDSEAYGCLIYYNGWDAPDRGHGHGIYAQNENGVKLITDNILFSGFSHGIHIFGSASAFLDNFDIEGNTTFNAGSLSASGGRNLLLGGNGVAHNPILKDNLMYRSAHSGDDFNLGYSGGCANATVSDNYVANTTDFVKCVPVVVANNTFYGSINGFSQSQFSANTYYSQRPTGVKVFVRPNAYEPGRAHVTVFNWDGVGSVDVDLSDVLSAGDVYEVRNAEDFFGTPVASGTYAGAPVTLPLGGLSVAAPIGHSAPASSGTEFNVFVVVTTAGPKQQVRPLGRAEGTPRVVER